MNRRKFFFKTIAMTAVLFLGAQVFDSCKKDNPVVKLEDVINKAPEDKLKATVTAANTLADLPAPLIAAAETVITPDQSTALFDNVDFNAAVQFVTANIVISDTEVTQLKANDVATFNTVINRMTSLPSYISESMVSSVYSNMQNNTELSAYTMEATTSTDPLYEGDYYQAALDVQKLIQDYTIPMLQKLATLKTTSTKSASNIAFFNRSGGALSGGIWGFLLYLRRFIATNIYHTGA